MLAGLLLAVAYSPIVQKWYLERLLARRPGLNAKVDWVWAGFSHARLEGVKLQQGNATLTAPTLDFGLPVVQWLREGKAPLRTVVAKDWVLKFDQSAAAPQTGAASAKSVAIDPARAALAWLGEILSRWEMPADVAIDAVDLEGDVIFPAQPDRTPTTIHVALKGGRIAAGETAVFTVEAMLQDQRLPRNPLPVHGQLKIAMETARRINRVELAGTTDLARDGTQGNTPCAFEVEAARGSGGDTYRVALVHEGRRLVDVTASYAPATDTLAGNWKVDWQTADAAVIGAQQLGPIERLKGAGKFDGDLDFSRVNFTGHAQASGRNWQVLTPWLERIGPATVMIDFKGRRDGEVVGIDRLEAVIHGKAWELNAQTLGPVKFDFAANKIDAGSVQTDWLETEAHGVPLAWFADAIAGYTLSGGAVAGEFLLGGTGDQLTVRSKTPCVANGVSLRRGERLLARDLDLSAAVKAQTTLSDGAWQVEAAPMTFAQGGTVLARVESKASRAVGEEKPVAVEAKWSAEVAAIVARGVVPGTAWVTAQTASGDFSGTITGFVEGQGAVRVVGHDPKHTAEGTVQGDLYPDGTVTFTAPLSFTLGQGVSDMQIEWEWRGDAPQRGGDLKLTGKSVALDAIRLVAAPFLALNQGATFAKIGGAERRPFWGDWTGHIQADFERVRLADGDLIDVGGYLQVEPGKLELISGHGGPERRSFGQVEGKLTFDPEREWPYQVHATASDSSGDAESVFGPAPKEGEPLAVGRFTVERSLDAKGSSLAELIAQREERFTLHGKNGIVRILKTGVAQALPSAPEGSKAMGALDDVGTVFGRLFGSSKKSLSSGEVKVDKRTQAVLDLDLELAEIGYDTLTITAIRQGDGMIRIPGFDLAGPNLHLTGRGEIERGKSGSLISERPVKFQMRWGAQGRIAELMEKAGLKIGTKDAAGYRWVDGTFYAVGTLKQLDQKEWRTKLVEAVTSKTKAEKK